MLPSFNLKQVALLCTLLSTLCHGIEITDYSQGQIIEPGFPVELFCRSVLNHELSLKYKYSLKTYCHIISKNRRNWDFLSFLWNFCNEKRDSTLEDQANKGYKDFTIGWNSSSFAWLAEMIVLRIGVIIWVTQKWRGIW